MGWCEVEVFRSFGRCLGKAAGGERFFGRTVLAGVSLMVSKGEEGLLLKQQNS